MTLKEAYVGMRIKYIGKNCSEGPRPNQTGTIIHIKSSTHIRSGSMVVHFNESFPGGHDCGGQCEDRNGFYFYSSKCSGRQSECYKYLVSSYSWRKL